MKIPSLEKVNNLVAGFPAYELVLLGEIQSFVSRFPNGINLKGHFLSSFGALYSLNCYTLYTFDGRSDGYYSLSSMNILQLQELANFLENNVDAPSN